MIGPTAKPDLKPGDHHIIVNDISETMKCYKHDGTLLWEEHCLARGQGADTTWNSPHTDTPPGLYKLGQIYNDIDRVGKNPAHDRTLRAYGWVTIDMVSLDHHEEQAGRAGICMHGGGSGDGWPGAWAPRQHLLPTFGCVRAYNEVVHDKVLPLMKEGTVYVSVYQEG